MPRQHYAVECSDFWARYACRSLHKLVNSNRECSRAAETPFEDGTFKLVLTFDESYPNKPPTVKFQEIVREGQATIVRSTRFPNPLHRSPL